MLRPLVLVGALGAALAGALSRQDVPSLPSAGSGHGVDWHTDLEKARRLAADSGRPLMVVFR